MDPLILRFTQGSKVSWGRTSGGSFNIVREIRVDDGRFDPHSTGASNEAVVRIPLLTKYDSFDKLSRVSRIYSSEVETITYIKKHSSAIPVPTIYHFEPLTLMSEIGFPIIIMEKICGELLSKRWAHMDDISRSTVLRHMASISLEAFQLRKHVTGVLTTFDLNQIHDESFILEESNPIDNIQMTRVHQPMSCVAYWNNRCSQNLKKIEANNFGQIAKTNDYAIHWILRTLVVALYNNNLDIDIGTVLTHPDLDAHNIFVRGEGTATTVVAVIDWSNASFMPAWSSAMYPRFLSDDILSPNEIVKLRGKNDELVFLRHLQEIEQSITTKTRPASFRVLSPLLKHALARYCFQQCEAHDVSPDYFEFFYAKLTNVLFGISTNDDSPLSYKLLEYETRLMHHYNSHKKNRFEEDATIFEEFVDTFGDSDREPYTATQIHQFALNQLDRVSPGGALMKWVKECNSTTPFLYTN